MLEWALRMLRSRSRRAWWCFFVLVDFGPNARPAWWITIAFCSSLILLLFCSSGMICDPGCIGIQYSFLADLTSSINPSYILLYNITRLTIFLSRSFCFMLHTEYFPSFVFFLFRPSDKQLYLAVGWFLDRQVSCAEQVNLFRNNSYLSYGNIELLRMRHHHMPSAFPSILDYVDILVVGSPATVLMSEQPAFFPLLCFIHCRLNVDQRWKDWRLCIE